ncbi:hypothetical protein NKH77_06785 [Streptomyces sp. M19]
MQHVGVSASFPMRRRQELMTELEPLLMDSVEGHPGRSGHTRRHTRAAGCRGAQPLDGTQGPLVVAAAPERVCEVAYDHMQGDRFRHTARFRRWRPDREPRQCTYAQLEEPVRYDLARVLGADQSD